MTHCPMPVASAAPEIPSMGKGPRPKMSTGSRMMLVMEPHSRAAIVSFMRPTAWNSFSKQSSAMMTGAKKNAILEYRTPRAMTASSPVKSRRKPGIMAMQTTAAIRPCRMEKTRPWVAAVSARQRSPAPEYSAIRALMPTPKPMAMALIMFCTGYTSESAVMACSLIWATKKLSTMLYSAFTVMESTMGNAMETSSGKIGRSFIKVSFTGKV